MPGYWGSSLDKSAFEMQICPKGAIFGIKKMIARTLSTALEAYFKQFPIVFLTGPRQSGKTTLLRSLFPKMPYASLEDPDVRELALKDPRNFLASYPQGAVLDEVQRAPLLFSYLQGIVDNDPKLRFILSGSQHFLMMKHINQSLAGRAGVLALLPLSLLELKRAGKMMESPEEQMFRGMYPRLYAEGGSAQAFYTSYLNTYIERDVRQLQNIGDLSDFLRFLRLCAGRIGQVLNISSLASDAGISPNTAKSWLSVLEASYVCFRLMPHYANFHKRLIKSSKLYFYDTGLACSLLYIEEARQLTTHFARGQLFENLIILELLKHRLHRARQPNLYFWRDRHGHEVDCLLDRAGELTPVEIKAGKTFNFSYFDGLNYWLNLSGSPAEKAWLIYAGEDSRRTSSGNLLSWKEVDKYPE